MLYLNLPAHAKFPNTVEKLAKLIDITQSHHIFAHLLVENSQGMEVFSNLGITMKQLPGLIFGWIYV